MLVISKNLAGLVESTGLCDVALVEEFSICIKLDSQVRRMLPAKRRMLPILYGSHYEAEQYFGPTETIGRDLILNAGERVLACSAHAYNMPSNYFGLVQTKGSLARLFVSTTCNDGQVEPGYHGKITLEISNASNFTVVIPAYAGVAQLFIQRCSMAAAVPYDGRYQGATGPTVANFSDNPEFLKI